MTQVLHFEPVNGAEIPWHIVFEGSSVMWAIVLLCKLSNMVHAKKKGLNMRSDCGNTGKPKPCSK